MTTEARTTTLRVPGATLHVETLGSGPPLLLIAGGPQDAGVFADLARHLADRHTLVAYDPRGNSRSRFDGEPVALQVEVQGDDAAALIRSLHRGPIDVFGTSGGAQIGLDLAARYPGLVRTLVAHEPPTTLLLDDPSAALAADEEILETYRREGVGAAMQRFFAMNGLEDDDPGDETESGDPGATPPEMMPTDEDIATMERVSDNFEYWLAHGMVPLSLYVPDVAALRAGTPRLVVAIGERSEGQMIEAMATALADRLGVVPVRFPGDHMGFASDAPAFAKTLVTTLEATTAGWHLEGASA